MDNVTAPSHKKPTHRATAKTANAEIVASKNSKKEKPLITTPAQLPSRRGALNANLSVEAMRHQLNATLRRAETAEREIAKLKVELHKTQTAYRNLEKIHHVQTDILYAIRDGAA